METCYKVFRRELIQAIPLEEDRFGFEPEVTCKLAKTDARIYEVGIAYHGRTYAEGKKIGMKDGFRGPLVHLEISLPAAQTQVRVEVDRALVLRGAGRLMQAVSCPPTKNPPTRRPRTIGGSALSSSP